MIEITISDKDMGITSDMTMMQEEEAKRNAVINIATPLRIATEHISKSVHYLFHDGMDIRFSKPDKPFVEADLLAILKNRGYEPKVVKIYKSDIILLGMLTPFSVFIIDNELSIKKMRHFAFNQYGIGNTHEAFEGFLDFLFYIWIQYDRDQMKIDKVVFALGHSFGMLLKLLFWLLLTRIGILTKERMTKIYKKKIDMLKEKENTFCNYIDRRKD